MRKCPSSGSGVVLVLSALLLSICCGNPISSSVLLNTGSGLAGLAPFGVTTIRSQSYTTTSCPTKTSFLPSRVHSLSTVTTSATASLSTMTPKNNTTTVCSSLTIQPEYHNYTYTYCCTPSFDYAALGLGWQQDCQLSKADPIDSCESRQCCDQDVQEGFTEMCMNDNTDCIVDVPMGSSVVVNCQAV